MPHLPLQSLMTGEITGPVTPPAPVTAYKEGDVFALHISHRQGSIAITTTAGALIGQFGGLKADVVMLSVGLLGLETKERQLRYWKEAVEAVNPHTVIPIHWDSFLRQLDPDPNVETLRAVRVRKPDETRAAMDFVRTQSGQARDVWVLGARDSFLLRNHAAIRCLVSKAGTPQCLERRH